jgi:hypothetical protein
VDADSQLRAALPGSEGERGARNHSLAVEVSFLGESGQACGIGTGGLGAADDRVVAGHLALGAKATLEPPEGRIQGEGDEAKLLQEVGPVVEAAQVLCLVKHDLLELSRGKAGEQPGGEQDSRAEETNDTGAIEMVGEADLGGPSEQAASGKAIEYLVDRRREGVGCDGQRGTPQAGHAKSVSGKGGKADRRGDEPESRKAKAAARVQKKKRARVGLCGGDEGVAKRHGMNR